MHEGFLLSRLVESDAVTIRRENEPFFWYAAGVPGAFYVNTERAVGTEVSKSLLNAINEVLDRSANASERALSIKECILNAYESNGEYKEIVKHVMPMASSVAHGEYVISGGERRDWLFSIPVAYQLGKPHIYLFKNGTAFIENSADNRHANYRHAVHISDLIHNAASYTAKWLPALTEMRFEMIATHCLVARGDRGINALREKGIRTSTAETIDRAFMSRACIDGVISSSTFAEVAMYFDDSREWALRGLSNLGVEALGINQATKTTRERIRAFLENDPWSLSSEVPVVFADGLELLNVCSVPVAR